ncbi:DUF4282 domain-containing protein [Pseudonocardia sp. CA-107938]|uniref:DUF4282 domain-containing protein n=1 Tax=Pseudonocardia sp. CA-107938 TaxID=3240021 RepID=UPI003D8F1274
MKVRDVLDPSFETRMTPRLLPLIYLGLVGALAVAAIGLVVGAFLLAWWLGLIALVVVPIGAAVAFAVLRVVVELVVEFSRLPQLTSGLAEGFARVEGMVDDIAEGMPRIAFLRGPRRPAAAPPSPQEKLQA